MTVTALIVGVVLAASAAADDLPRFHRAHWVESADLQPTYHRSSWRGMAFPSPAEGWFVGSKYILHMRGDGLEVAFLDLWDSFSSVSFADASDGWLAGSGPPQGAWPLLRFRSDRWHAVSLKGMPWPAWSIRRVMAGPLGGAWAIVVRSQERPMPPTALLRFDGTAWAVDDALLAGEPGVAISDACQAADGTWWFVGGDFSTASGMSAVLAPWTSGRLGATLRPSNDRERSFLSDVRCAADGSVWALGRTRNTADQPEQILLLRRTSEWQRLAVPSDLPGSAAPTSLAPIDAHEVWVSANCGVLEAACRERYFHWHDGVWQTVELPLMPEGRSTKISIVDTQFVSPNEGWAIAEDLQPRTGGARIFHYRDGTWRNRNWNWHFWDAPWFGLVGY